MMATLMIRGLDEAVKARLRCPDGDRSEGSVPTFMSNSPRSAELIWRLHVQARSRAALT